MSAVKKLCICAFCIALCCVLPPAFHALGLGMAFSPMHLPALLCGLLCGAPYGAFCGLAGPLLASMVNGMPGAAQLIHMVPELMVYGLVTGLLFSHIRTGRTYPDLLLSLIPAMLAGRIVGGAVQAMVYLSSAQEYTLALWAGSYLVGTAPGAVLHIVLIPVLVLALTKAKLVPPRYPVAAKA